MIPKLTHASHISEVVIKYVDILKKQGFSGEISLDYADRLTMATDNSIYQIIPQAIVFPANNDDVLLLTQVAKHDLFTHLCFTPRGGGTGTNGQALNENIIVDLSRYMHHILEINLEERWVRVEAGVIKDQLNQYLKPFGYFFSPELSTSNRATIGGMINTDASGQGSLVYGKTSDHVLGLKAITIDGIELATAPMSLAETEKFIQGTDRIHQIYRIVFTRCRENRQLILQKFPDLNRFLTGYDLKNVFTADLQQFDLSRILTGSEGTLAFITEAKLNITPIPQVRKLINIKYQSFDAALRNAPFMIKANALSVETIDSKVLNLAREDIIWHAVKELISDIPNNQINGLNIVEFAGNNRDEIENNVSSLRQQLDQLIEQGSAGVLGYQVCDNLADIERIYAMRKKAVGLLGNTRGAAKPIPFVEDTCVPPQHLADYITEFRQLLDSYQLEYGMFGHVDAGVLHVRPVLDLCDYQQEKLIRTISDKVVELTAKYGGLLWGEHGKGVRSEYSQHFFGEALFNELKQIKTVFDAKNRLNPGKICTPVDNANSLISIDADKRATFDRQIPLHVRQTFRGAMECNGNGLCFNFDVNSTMCPSMKITAHRLHSPKGRATVIREWLRLLSEQGVDPVKIEQQLMNRGFSVKGCLQRWYHHWQTTQGKYDFSHEVKEAMSGCLACKACANQCPIKIDVPNFRSRFLQLYYTRYPRTLCDLAVGYVESYTPWLAKLSQVSNFFIKLPMVQKISEKYLGLVDLPLFSSPTLQQRLSTLKYLPSSLDSLKTLDKKLRKKYVLLIQDPFTSYYEAQLVVDLVQLIQTLNFYPILVPFTPNGKALHVKGFLKQFAQQANKTAHFLCQYADFSMIGIDPALVLCYRDEYQQALGDKRGEFHVELAHEWLSRNLNSFPQITATSEPWYLFNHCTESTLLPQSAAQWKTIFKHFGMQLKSINIGCCGMAGTYGHEVTNLQNSKGIYALSWQQQLAKLPKARCLSTGYSCRSQVKRLEGYTLCHPIQILLGAITQHNKPQVSYT